MKSHHSRQLAYWFLKTGDMREASLHVNHRELTERGYESMFNSKGFQSALVYWLRKLKMADNSMGFHLHDAEAMVNDVLQDLRNRMKRCTADEYAMYSKRFLDMLVVFGGNWSGFDKAVEPERIGGGIFTGERRYLEEGQDAEFQEIEPQPSNGNGKE